MTKGMVLLLACLLSVTVIVVALILDDGDSTSKPSRDCHAGLMYC